MFYHIYGGYLKFTNYVSMVHNVTIILSLQFVVHVTLFPMKNILSFYITRIIIIIIIIGNTFLARRTLRL
jgi:hypothetical protein